MKGGVLISHRHKFDLLKSKFLTDEEFVLYEFCVHMADFDENHTGKFGTFERLTNEELALEMGWKKDKFGKNLNKIAAKGLIKLTKRRIEVVNYSSFLPKYGYNNKEYPEFLHSLIDAKTLSEDAKTLQRNANLRFERSDLAFDLDAISDISSFKGDYVLSLLNESYKNPELRIKMDPATMEEQSWVNENLADLNTTRLEFERLEQCVIEVFFNRDINMYCRHVL